MALSVRDKDAQRKRAKSEKARIVTIPPCKNRKLRDALELDDVAWLMHYFAPESGTPSPFTYEFTIQQREMIEAIRQAIVTGGDQAIAASRGEGKTTLCERMLLKYTLSGVIKFSVLFASTGSAAQDCLESIKAEIETNTRLAESYPEVCTPVEKLENTPNRAHYQLVQGKRHDTGKAFKPTSSKFSWCGQEIVFPKVPGSPSAGAIIATRGLDSAVRGVKKRGRRPDVAVIDDPDTEETARSEEQGKKLEDRIDRAIAGLGSQTRRIARVMLTTLQNRICVSYRFTDPTVKPSWGGKRFRFLVKPPTNIHLWEEYVRLQQDDWQNGTTLAHEHYVANRDEMDLGAVVANPNRYTTGELSALQHYFNEVARIGPDAVSTEYDNDPKSDLDSESSTITSAMVATRINGLPHREVPRDSQCLSAFLDVGNHYCHWVAIAWRGQAIGCLLDHGVLDVPGIFKDSTPGEIERKLLATLHDWADGLMQNPFKMDDGTECSLNIAGIDSGSGLHQSAVYQFVRDRGAPFVACKGIDGGKFYQAKPDRNRTVGEHWNKTYQPGDRLFLHNTDGDYWKRWVHERFLSPTFDDQNRFRPGTLSLFALPKDSRDKDHEQYAKDRREYCHQIVAEIWSTRRQPGKPAKEGWDIRSHKNHWLDATAGACALANVMGVRLMAGAGPARSKPSERKTLAQLAQGR